MKRIVTPAALYQPNWFGWVSTCAEIVGVPVSMLIPLTVTELELPALSVAVPETDWLAPALGERHRVGAASPGDRVAACEREGDGSVEPAARACGPVGLGDDRRPAVDRPPGDRARAVGAAEDHQVLALGRLARGERPAKGSNSLPSTETSNVASP